MRLMRRPIEISQARYDEGLKYRFNSRGRKQGGRYKRYWINRTSFVLTSCEFENFWPVYIIMRENGTICGRPNVHRIILPPRAQANLHTPPPKYPPTTPHSQLLPFLKKCPLASSTSSCLFYESWTWSVKKSQLILKQKPKYILLE